MDNRFIILVGSYNNEKWVAQNIESVLCQTHKNWKLVYYNADSTDKTYEIAKRYADLHSDRIVLFSDKPRHLKGYFFEKATSITPIHSNDVVCILDGDDFLASDEVLAYLNEVYNKTSCWMTYGGMVVWQGGDKTIEPFPQNSQPPQQVLDQKLYRQDLWRYSHMRTVRGFLWKRIKAEDWTAKHDGLYTTLEDLIMMYACLEMCPANKIFRVDQPVYVYNATETRACTETKPLAAIYEQEVRSRPKYPELPIVTPVLAGGLGNQMFEVAAAAALAKDNGAQLVLDTNTHILPNQGRNVKNYVNNIFSRLVVDNNPPVRSDVRVETSYYQPIPYQPNCRLWGHFQSHRYFDHHRGLIHQLFAPTLDIDETLERNYFMEEAAKITAIQVRRGDYVKFPQHHPLLPPEYYAKAVKMAGSGPVWIFSDDIEWCKQNLNFGDETRYVKDEDFIELYLMGLCKNLVISNSSFGWWAAYLGKAKVFAPNPWFGPALQQGFKLEDLVLPEWTVIHL